MAVSTFEPTRDVDIDFRNRRRRGLHTDSNMCNLEVKTTKNLEDPENLRYVNEHTCELVPLDEAEREAEEWIKSCEIVIVTKESIKSLLRGEKSKGSRKKKQKKKKNKKN
ncbi:hypothetical protein GLOIN_2v1472829 [Rhizophagus irregularis DAOM 181602=DAOM 197198]|uniref:PARP catalytic domain-containing protein n=1 Tax=Rhizophagus irregularis (strain DAOM 181602 / DAOM 197198 / MUCL 43194) TaxID=747089 RepID=A0A2P4QM72_RHIID|nr:hypothetical protein GLOIN_2v1472829 [Rhizophagus irregularis DAOM 181602=DAOM 197198]POG78708.1 hypothetical protein GLOIN_2v1472829 [Rhizophagus irregularis DAOM 181602=DAOM 197198]|eukprot:XP_025185574.1 hypothetical protein GLOIN_2v1472829 [Rhizophagus irregularis DAOM 181602=DAOM 197198]